MRQNAENYKRDIIFIATAAVVGIIFGIILLFTKKSGDIVEVSVDGVVEAEFSLDKDAEYEIEGVNGGINHLMIRDGCAWMEDASCPDGLCVNMGKISLKGQSIVCLPNKVVVKIVSKKNDGGTEPDFING